jgi:hypothetical protein
MTSITSANAVFMLSISTIFPSPQQLQGWASDDAFTTAVMKIAETMMGVDGLLSGGYVNVPVEQEVALQADSPSNAIFDQWRAAQLQVQDVYTATATIQLPGLGLKWAMTKGFLTGYPPLPDVKKLLQPKKFGLTWQSVVPAPI